MALSAYQQLRQIETEVRLSAANLDVRSLSPAARTASERLQRSLRSARDFLKDYEMYQLEEDTRGQARQLPRAIGAVEKARGSLLHASEYDLVSAVEVAQLSAQLDELLDSLR